MSNPIFYAADMSAAVFTMSETEDASYPLNNLYTNLPTLFWKSSTSTNNQTLNIDLGSAKACDFLGLGHHSLVYIKLQVGETDDGNFAAPVDVVDNVSAMAESFSSVTKRYWRLYFTNNNSIIPEIGLLYLGTKLSMPFNYDMDAEMNNKQFATTVKESLAGTLRTSRQVAGRMRAEVTFSLNDDNTVTAWQLFMDTIKGQLNPFFFKDDNGVLGIYHSEEDYVPAKGMRANVNDIARIKMRKQSIG